MIGLAGLDAGLQRARGKVQQSRERTKGDDEYDPYCKCIVEPFGLSAMTEDATDAGTTPDWTKKVRH